MTFIKTTGAIPEQELFLQQKCILKTLSILEVVLGQLKSKQKRNLPYLPKFYKKNQCRVSSKAIWFNMATGYTYCLKCKQKAQGIFIFIYLNLFFNILNMKKNTYLNYWSVLFIVLATINIHAQNLVLNPSFENTNITACSSAEGFQTNLLNWDDTNSGADSCSSPDLFSSCNIVFG